MTNEEMIKSASTEELAKFLMYIDEGHTVPKKYACDVWSCIDCKLGWPCYINWLKRKKED
jgi:hypothetical protein